MSFGERLKNLRKEKELTQEELGNLLGVKKAAIQKLESGSVQSLKISNIKKLCDYFEITADQLLLEKEEQLKNEVKLFAHISATYGSDAAKAFGIYLSLTNSNKQKVLSYIEDMQMIESSSSSSR